MRRVFAVGGTRATEPRPPLGPFLPLGSCLLLGLFLALALASCAGTTAARQGRTGAGEMEPPDVPVVSWEDVDAGRHNDLVESAAAEGAEWTRSPLLVALHVLGGDAEVPHLWLSERPNRVEFPDTTFIDVTRDGFRDDSVRGDWHRFVLRRLDDGTWRLHSLRRAFRCHRGPVLDVYSAEWCL